MIDFFVRVVIVGCRRSPPPTKSNCQSTPNAPPSLDELLADVSEPRIHNNLNQGQDGTASNMADQVDPATLKRKRQGEIDS